MTTKINPELGRILSKDKSLRPEAKQILEQLSVPKDASPTSEQKESLQFCCKLLDSAVGLDDAIQQTLEKVKEKPDAEYAPSAINQESINRAQLQKIAERYSMGDRVQEFMMALQFNLESLTTEQFEMFRTACAQVQQGIELPIVAQGVLNKTKSESSSEKSPQFIQAATAKHLPTQSTAIAPKTDRSKSGLITQEHGTIEGVPLDLEGGMTRLWDETLEQRVNRDAAEIAGAPFHAIEDASNEISPDKLYSSYRGRYFKGMKTKLDSPEMLNYAMELAKGKKSST
jgi:hypothetical protein